MPKREFSVPTLAEITYHYLGLHKQRARQSDYDQAENLFQKVLLRTHRVEEIRAALALDSARMLPVQLKSPAYERMLIIEGRTPKLLREYAQEMYEYGPEWTHYADMLWDEAKQLDGEGMIPDDPTGTMNKRKRHKLGHNAPTDNTAIIHK